MPVESKINNYALAAGAAGIPGLFLPGADLGAISALWIKMIYELQEESSVSVSNETIAKFVASVVGGAAFYIGGSKIFTTILTYTGIGAIPAAILNSALNYIYTKRLGKAVHEEFQKEHFDGYTFANMAASLLTVVFAFPGLFELKEAIQAVKS